jgi:hypothetical protein
MNPLRFFIIFCLPISLTAQYNFTSGAEELKGPGGFASQSKK